MSTYAPSAGAPWGPAAPLGALRPDAGRLRPEAPATAVAPAPGTDAAFFDLDNTVVRGAAVFHLARGLYRRRCFTGRDLAGFALKQARFRVAGREDVGDIAEATGRALDFVRGLRQHDVVATGEQIYDEVLSRKLWAGTVELAHRHVAAGHQVWVVTAAPVELASLVAQRLGLTGGLGTVAEVADGRYTGRLVGDLLHGPAKAHALRALAAREGLDLAACAAYSDSAHDLPMLSAVGHPCAVNPDRRLAEHARRHGWATNDFRASRRAVHVTRAGLPAVAGVGAAAVGAQVARRRAR